MEVVNLGAAKDLVLIGTITERQSNQIHLLITLTASTPAKHARQPEVDCRYPIESDNFSLNHTQPVVTLKPQQKHRHFPHH